MDFPLQGISTTLGQTISFLKMTQKITFTVKMENLQKGLFPQNLQNQGLGPKTSKGFGTAKSDPFKPTPKEGRFDFC